MIEAFDQLLHLIRLSTSHAYYACECLTRNLCLELPRLKGQPQLPVVQSCRSQAPYTRTIGRILQWSDLSDALTANAERTTSPRKVSSSLRSWFLGESQALAVQEEESSSSSTRSTSQSRALQVQREAQATLQPNHATTWGERVPEGRKL
jgi:hypothetical protein